jgi:hypothetical protein
MTTLYMVTNDALAVISRSNGAWHATLGLVGEQTQCVAVDPLRPQRVYCGTFGAGLWMSEDAGASWRHAGEGIAHPAIMAVAVSALERAGDAGVVWAGTEPSALFRSEDGGHT